MDNRIFALLSLPTAMLMLSCGDAVQPPAEGTVSFMITEPVGSTSRAACGASHSSLLGAQAPTNSDPGQTWVDGQDGHSVQCSVSSSGRFSGEIRSSPLSFRVTGQASVQTGGTATVSYYDTVLTDGLSDSACTLTVYRVEKGAIWAAVNCQNLRRGDPNTQCAMSGVFVFTSCDG